MFDMKKDFLYHFDLIESNFLLNSKALVFTVLFPTAII